MFKGWATFELCWLGLWGRGAMGLLNCHALYLSPGYYSHALTHFICRSQIAITKTAIKSLSGYRLFSNFGILVSPSEEKTAIESGAKNNLRFDCEGVLPAVLLARKKTRSDRTYGRIVHRHVEPYSGMLWRGFTGHFIKLRHSTAMEMLAVHKNRTWLEPSNRKQTLATTPRDMELRCKMALDRQRKKMARRQASSAYGFFRRNSHRSGCLDAATIGYDRKSGEITNWIYRHRTCEYFLDGMVLSATKNRLSDYCHDACTPRRLRPRGKDNSFAPRKSETKKGSAYCFAAKCIHGFRKTSFRPRSRIHIWLLAFRSREQKDGQAPLESSVFAFREIASKTCRSEFGKRSKNPTISQIRCHNSGGKRRKCSRVVGPFRFQDHRKIQGSKAPTHLSAVSFNPGRDVRTKDAVLNPGGPRLTKQPRWSASHARNAARFSIFAQAATCGIGRASNARTRDRGIGPAVLRILWKTRSNLNLRLKFNSLRAGSIPAIRLLIHAGYCWISTWRNRRTLQLDGIARRDSRERPAIFVDVAQPGRALEHAQKGQRSMVQIHPSTFNNNGAASLAVSSTGEPGPSTDHFVSARVTSSAYFTKA
jgi:hypothetical protein